MVKTSRPRRSKRTTISRSSRQLPVGMAVAITLSLPISPAPSQDPQAQEGQRVHVVKEGDTLWDLARFYLTDPFLWPEIYRLNTMVVEDPHWIFPEEVLRLPFPAEAVAVRPETVPGVPPETVPGLPPVAPAETLAAMPPETALAEQVLVEHAYPESLTIFAGRTAAEREGRLIYQPLELVPGRAVSAGDFRRSGWLAPLSELGRVARVLEPIAPSAVRAQLPPNVGLFERFYITFPGGRRPTEGEQYLLFRIDRTVDPWGVIVRPTGLATIAAVHDEVATAVLVETYARVLSGDRAVRAEPFSMTPGIFARDVPAGTSGHVITLLDPQPVPSTEDIVFIDRGRDHGVVVGDEFEIFLRERPGRGGYTYPEERVAVGRVVRTTDKTSTVRILSLRHPALSRGLAVRLIRKMP